MCNYGAETPQNYCATVGFAIESANTVGYTGSTSGADNNFINVPFNAVGYNTADIQQIVISRQMFGR